VLRLHAAAFLTFLLQIRWNFYFGCLQALALLGSFVSYIYSAPPLKLKQSGWAGNYALGSSYIALPWWAGQVGRRCRWPACVDMSMNVCDAATLPSHVSFVCSLTPLACIAERAVQNLPRAHDEKQGTTRACSMQGKKHGICLPCIPLLIRLMVGAVMPLLIM